jgi:hypothetical protein
VLIILFLNPDNVCVGLEVLTVVVMKSAVFRDIALRSPLKVKRCFGRTHRLLLQRRKISQARYQRESRCQTELWTALCRTKLYTLDSVYLKALLIFAEAILI